MFGGFDGSNWNNQIYKLDCNGIINKKLEKQNSESLTSNLYKNLFNKKEFSDFTFIVEEKYIYAHRAILIS